MSGHRMRLALEDGHLVAELLCPDEGCAPATVCARCGRDALDALDAPTEPCPDCPSGEGCWVAGHVADGFPDEWHEGRVELGEFDADADWDRYASRLRLSLTRDGDQAAVAAAIYGRAVRVSRRAEPFPAFADAPSSVQTDYFELADAALVALGLDESTDEDA